MARTTNRSTAKNRIRTILLGAVALLAAAATPAMAVPAGEGAVCQHRTGGIVVSCYTAAECWAGGGEIQGDGIRAYCCTSIGSGRDKIVVCDEVDQLIDMIVTPTTPKITRPFGQPSRFTAQKR